MHNWILLDITEMKKVNEIGLHVFSHREYIIICYECEIVRIVKEETFDRMNYYGLIERVGNNER